MTQQVAVYLEQNYIQPGPKTGKIPGFIKAGMDFGHIKEGYTIKEYLQEAVVTNGYETVGIHGVQGSGKSCLTLQMGADIAFPYLKQELGRDPNEKELWDFVLNSLVFKPKEFVKKLEAVPRGKRLPMILWDDLGVHFTSSSFRTDIEQYSAIDATWAAIRTKVAVAVINIPLFIRLAKNVKDNLTFEVYVGRNKMVQIRRLFYLPGQIDIDENLFKPIIQPGYQYNIYDVPKWVWDAYWERRLDLTEEALTSLKEATDMEENKDWIPIKTAALEVGRAASSISHDVSQGVYRGLKIKGVMCIHKDDFEMLKQTKAKVRYRRIDRIE